jgi:hypothetical protein
MDTAAIAISGHVREERGDSRMFEGVEPRSVENVRIFGEVGGLRGHVTAGHFSNLTWKP